LKRFDFGLLHPSISSTVTEIPRVSKFVTTQLDFSAMLQDVEAYASTVLPRFVGEALEEVGPIFEALQANLRLSSTVVRRWPDKTEERVWSVLRELSEAIPDLQQDYGVEDTGPLEKIEQDLRTWLQEQNPNRPPGGPAPAPI
jgi:hypothetical protein